jgi:hypothetical protein
MSVTAEKRDATAIRPFHVDIPSPPGRSRSSFQANSARRSTRCGRAAGRRGRRAGLSTVSAQTISGRDYA